MATVNRVSLTITIGLIVALAGCSRQQSAEQTTPPETKFMIDYAHESDGVFLHGTFSLIGDKVRATWTIDKHGNKKSLDVAMTEETFRGIWDAFNDVPDFKAGMVKDQDQKLDWRTHHVVGIVFNIEGQEGMRTYMIPAKGSSAAFKDWLTKLEQPSG